MNQILSKIVAVCRRFRIAIEQVFYVSTEQNAADPLSRAAALDGARANELLALLMGSLRPDEVDSPRVDYAAKRTGSCPGDGP